MTPLEDNPFGQQSPLEDMNSSSPQQSSNASTPNSEPELCKIVCRTKDGNPISLADLDPTSVSVDTPMTIEIISPCHLILTGQIAPQKSPFPPDFTEEHATQNLSHTAILRKEKRAEQASQMPQLRSRTSRKTRKKIRLILLLTTALAVGIVIALIMRQAPEAAEAVHDAVKNELRGTIDNAVKGSIRDARDQQAAKFQEQIDQVKNGMPPPQKPSQ